MGNFSARVAFDLEVPGATIKDLRASVAKAPAGVTAEVRDHDGELRLTASQGFSTPHGGASGHAVLTVTQEPGPLLRLEGHIRPGRYNLMVLAPFNVVAVLFGGIGLLLMIGNWEAIGLVIVGAFFGVLSWVVRRVERDWLRQVAVGLGEPEGWLLPSLQAASRRRNRT